MVREWLPRGWLPACSETGCRRAALRDRLPSSADRRAGWARTLVAVLCVCTPVAGHYERDIPERSAKVPFNSGRPSIVPRCSRGDAKFVNPVCLSYRRSTSTHELPRQRVGKCGVEFDYYSDG